MYCSGCGQALVAGQGFCPRCGQGCGQASGMPVGPGASGLPVSNMYGPFPLGLVERRINTLAVVWLVYAGLIAVTGFVGLAFAQAFIMHMRPWQHGMWHVWEGPFMPGFFLRFAWIAVGVRLGLALTAGYGLMQKTQWGRWVAIVAGILALIHLPLGTIVGVWTLVVLLSAPTVGGYEMLVRE